MEMTLRVPWPGEHVGVTLAALGFLISEHTSEPVVKISAEAVSRSKAVTCCRASLCRGSLLTEPRRGLSALSVGQKPFKRSLRGSDALSETSSASHIEDLEKVERLSGGLEQITLEASSTEGHPGAPSPQHDNQSEAFQKGAPHPEDDHPQVEGAESLR